MPITREMIHDGISRGVVKFVLDPRFEFGTVCQIGEYWFYFGGEEADENDPAEYLEITDLDENVECILAVLNSLKNTNPDEYDYYEAILRDEDISPDEYDCCEATFREHNRESIVIPDTCDKLTYGTHFHPGDKVIIKEWEDMADEFGVESEGYIRFDFGPGFNPKMRYLCGTTFIVQDNEDLAQGCLGTVEKDEGTGVWYIWAAMVVKPEDLLEETEEVEQFLQSIRINEG